VRTRHVQRPVRQAGNCVRQNASGPGWPPALSGLKQTALDHAAQEAVEIGGDAVLVHAIPGGIPGYRGFTPGLKRIAQQSGGYGRHGMEASIQIDDATIAVLRDDQRNVWRQGMARPLSAGSGTIIRA
jgi:hypothetical protein